MNTKTRTPKRDAEELLSLHAGGSQTSRIALDAATAIAAGQRPQPGAAATIKAALESAKDRIANPR